MLNEIPLWYAFQVPNGFFTGNHVAVFHPQIEQCNLMGNADTVIDAVFDDCHIEISGNRIHTGGTDTTAGRSPGDNQSVCPQLYEETEKRGSIKGTRITLVNYEAIFLRCQFINDLCTSCSLEILRLLAICFSRKTIKPDAGMNLSGIYYLDTPAPLNRSYALYALDSSPG